MTELEVPEEQKQHELHGPEIVLLFLFICLLIGCACRFILEVIHRKLKIRVPYSVVLLVLGGSWGALAWKNLQDNDGETKELATISLTLWANIDPHLILFVFLPALIYECAMGTNFYVFSNHFGSAIILAGPGMLVQTFLIAIVGRYMLPYEWGWAESMLFGGILSATDPVAVIALLKELGVLPDLRVLIEAESLLNDGTAIVVYELCLMILIEPSTIGNYVATGFQLVLGAPALGLAMFLGSVFWLNNTKDPIQDTIVTVCTAYLGFYVAESGAGVSGVLTVVTIGIMMAGYGNTSINTEEAAHMLHAVWSIVVFCADTTIFVLAGAIIIERGFIAREDAFSGSDWGYLIALYLCLLAIRAFMVVICSPYFRNYGYGLQSRTCSWEKFVKNMFIVTWGGLRGAVGLVLALAVSVNLELQHAVVDERYGDRVLLHVAGIVVLTTLVNAALMEKIIKMLGMSEVSHAEKQLYEGALNFLDEKHEEFLDTLQNRTIHPELANVDWHAVAAIVGKQALTGRQENMEETEELGGSSSYMYEKRQHSFAHLDSPADIEREFLGRYLTSLRASYTGQWNAGLIAARPYRRLLWALDMALDHCYDSGGDYRRFEWHWLQSEGLLELPWYLRYLQEISFLRFVWTYLVEQNEAERFEIVSAIVRAHEETSRCEIRPGALSEVFLKILDESLTVRDDAEQVLKSMEHENSKIAKSVRTRQACCLVLKMFEEEVHGLSNLSQITDGEKERLQHLIHDKMTKCTTRYPKVAVQANVVQTWPIFKSIPTNKFDELYDSLALKAHIFPQGADLLKKGEPFQGIYFISQGRVDWSTDDCAFEEEECLLEEDEKPSKSVSCTPGSTIGEIEFLLANADLPALNRGSARVVTPDVVAFMIGKEQLSMIVDKYPTVLLKLWQHHGHILANELPQLFENMTTEIPFSNASLKTLIKGRKHVIRYPCLLVQGAVRLSKQPLLVGRKYGEEKRPFVFISQETALHIECTGEHNRILTFTPEHESIVERRSAEMSRVPWRNRNINEAVEAVEHAHRVSTEIRRSIEGRRSVEHMRSNASGGVDEAPGSPSTGLIRLSVEMPRSPGYHRWQRAVEGMGPSGPLPSLPSLELEMDEIEKGEEEEEEEGQSSLIGTNGNGIKHANGNGIEHANGNGIEHANGNGNGSYTPREEEEEVKDMRTYRV